jgi:hypothetical protein
MIGESNSELELDSPSAIASFGPTSGTYGSKENNYSACKVSGPGIFVPVAPSSLSSCVVPFVHCLGLYKSKETTIALELFNPVPSCLQKVFMTMSRSVPHTVCHCMLLLMACFGQSLLLVPAHPSAEPYTADSYHNAACKHLSSCICEFQQALSVDCTRFLSSKKACHCMDLCFQQVCRPEDFKWCTLQLLFERNLILQREFRLGCPNL